MWLREWLPVDEPRIRVLVYYHNSGWEQNALNWDIRDFADDMLSKLEKYRNSDQVIGIS
jgi:hypothetical protein